MQARKIFGSDFCIDGARIAISGNDYYYTFGANGVPDIEELLPCVCADYDPCLVYTSRDAANELACDEQCTDDFKDFINRLNKAVRDMYTIEGTDEFVRFCRENGADVCLFGACIELGA